MTSDCNVPAPPPREVQHPDHGRDCQPGDRESPRIEESREGPLKLADELQWVTPEFGLERWLAS
jgi:hypothetical protein